MATGTSKKVTHKNTDIYIESVKTWVYSTIRGVGQDGEMVITYSETGSYGNRKVITFPVVSVWVDTVNAREQNTCKVYGAVPKRAATLDDLGRLEFARRVRAAGAIQCYSASPAQSLTVDPFETVIRYGADAEHYLANDGASHSSYQPIYDTKAIAITAILTALSGYSTAKIAGLDLINLNAVSDKVLEELGFLQVPDVLRRGVPMWTGDADKALSMGSSSYVTRRWNANRSDTDIERSSQSEIIESFLNLLESELSK